MHSIAGVFSCRAGYPSKSQSALRTAHLPLPLFITSDAAVVDVVDDDDDHPIFRARVPLGNFDTYRTATIGNVRPAGCDVVVHHFLASFPRRREHPRFGRKAGTSTSWMIARDPRALYRNIVLPVPRSFHLSPLYTRSRLVPSSFLALLRVGRIRDEPNGYRPSGPLISCALRTDYRAARRDFRSSGSATFARAI